MNNKNKLTLLSVTSTAALVIVISIIHTSISQFDEMFKLFESDVPLATNLILLTYKFWWIFPITTLLLGIDILRRASLPKRYSTLLFRVYLGGFVLAVLLYILADISMYYGVLSMETSNT